MPFNHTLNCQGQLVDLTSPKIMGILNVTPDSFYDGGKFNTSVTLLQQCEKMLKAGADIIDVGGMSSRPDASMITEEEELKRVIPAIESISNEFSTSIISVDTFRGRVARESVGAGANIVNDISGGTMDENMFPTIIALNVPYIMMHIRGTPVTMQKNTTYTNVVAEILDFLTKRINLLRGEGVKDIIADVGFGFGKSLDDNYFLLKKLSVFQSLGVPLLVGISRKSMIYKLLNNTPAEALNGATALHFFALQQGANLLRVHDVKEAKEVVKIHEKLNNITKL
jgi:dihydropteroate synthase